MRGARVPEEAREASARTRSKFAPCGRFPRLLGYTFSLFFSARDAYGAAAFLIICAHQPLEDSRRPDHSSEPPIRQATKRSVPRKVLRPNGSTSPTARRVASARAVLTHV